MFDAIKAAVILTGAVAWSAPVAGVPTTAGTGLGSDFYDLRSPVVNLPAAEATATAIRNRLLCHRRRPRRQHIADTLADAVRAARQDVRAGVIHRQHDVFGDLHRSIRQ